MERKDFLKLGLFGTGIFATSATGISALANNIDDISGLKPMLLDHLGFNHLPNTNSKIMANTVLHKADTRGVADHGWLII